MALGLSGDKIIATSYISGCRLPRNIVRNMKPNKALRIAGHPALEAVLDSIRILYMEQRLLTRKGSRPHDTLTENGIMSLSLDRELQDGSRCGEDVYQIL